MLGTVAILAFALSDDPAGEYRNALHGVEEISQLDTSRVISDVAARYTKDNVFPAEGIKSPDSSAHAQDSFAKCLSGSKVEVSLTSAVVLVPDPTTATISTTLGYLSEAEVYLAQASTQAVANVLRSNKFDCDIALKAGLAAIRIGNNEVAIRPIPGVRSEVRGLSSLELVKYTSKMGPNISKEQYTFNLMEAIAQTASIELEYHKDDAISIKKLMPEKSFASPARDSITNPFATYLPDSAAAQETVLGALRRNLGLIGDLNTARATELLKTKIEEKAKYPTVYGVEIRSLHAVWGLPVLLLALACFLLVHVQAYRRAHTQPEEKNVWLPNVLLISGIGTSVARVLSLVVLPPISCVLLVQRLSDPAAPLLKESWAGYGVCLLLATVGAMTLWELYQLRGEQAAQKTAPIPRRPRANMRRINHH